MPGYRMDLSNIRVPAGVLLAGSVVLGHLPSGVGLPCPLRTLTGIPCPFCGMTTSLRGLTAGQLGRSLAAAPLGLPFVLAALLGVVGKLPSRLTLNYWVIATVLGAEWLFELFRFHTI
jgi:hypothetical protein